MDRTSIPRAQREWLKGELKTWQSLGILTADQALRILGVYETPDEDGLRKRSLAVHVLQSMAAFLFGLAVLLLIGFNWEAIPREGKVAVVLLIVAATHALGFFLRFKTKQSRLAEVVFFLGCMFYGAGICLVAQAYHLNAHYPDGVWWWAVGVLPFALVLESVLLHLWLVCLLALWAGMEVFGFAQLTPWWLFGFAPNGAYSLPILALPGLLWATRRPSVAGVGLYVPLLAWWVVLQSFAWGIGGRSVFLVGTMGAVLLILAEVHKAGNPMAIPYRLWGTALSAGSLIAVSSSEFWRYSLSGRGFDTAFSPVAAAGIEISLMLALLLGGAALLVVRKKGLRDAVAKSGVVSRTWFPISLAGVMTVSAAWSLTGFGSQDPFHLLPVVLANLAMLGLALYLVRVGIREERVRPFAFGVLYFLVWAFVRYLDLFAEAGGMLGAAALFALCAAGLVVVARFWGRTRKDREPEETSAVPEPEYVGPNWLAAAATRVGEHSRAILAATAVLHLAVLGGMVVLEAAPLWTGTRVTLRTRPVDPRDLFRGDYVVLAYDFGQPQMLQTPGATVYLRLEPDADGKHWHAAGYSAERPAGGVYLAGKCSRQFGTPEFGIEAYYVQEGRGLEWERLRNARKLTAEVAVSSSGKAKIVRLVVE